MLAFKTEKVKFRECLEGIHMWEVGGESICFREKRRAWVWEIDHRVRLRAEERRRREYEGPCRRIVEQWYVWLLGKYF